jgi:hypothetical protein
MSDTTGHDETRRDDSPNEIVVSVADAAATLGISEGAVRKRIERGQLVGRKVAGQWQIILNATDESQTTRHDATDQPTRQGLSHTTRRDTTTGAHDASQLPAVAPAAMAQLEAIRDEWLQPLIDQLKDQAEEIGRLKAERDTAVKDAEHLTAEIDALRASQNQRTNEIAGQGEAIAIERHPDALSPVSGNSQRSWWRFWGRG